MDFEKGEKGQFKEEVFFNLSHDPMGFLGSAFTLLKVNRFFIQLFGIENKELSEIQFEKLFHLDDLKTIRGHFSQLSNGSTVSFESRVFNANQELKWYSWRIIKDENKGIYFFSGVDITPYKTNQSVLEEHTEKLLKIIELVPHPIFLKDSSAKYSIVNQAQADLFSTTKNDFIGRDDNYFIKNEEELKGVHASDQVVLNKKKNIILPEQVITHPNGKKKILYTSKIPFLSNVNGEVNILGVSIDITEIKNSETELRKINFELDSFVYHASHDLKAPLCSLEGLFNLINTETDEEIRKKCVEEGLKSIKRLDVFISDLTNLSRNNRMVIVPVDIKFKKIIKKTLTNFKYLKNSDQTKVSVQIDKKVKFYSDKNRIKILFMNLISNAIKYQREDNDTPFLSISVKVTEQQAEIEFRDNGIGIEEKYRSKVFDMFFRGTVLATGSGLGLYIAKEVILKLGGKISLTSEENIGTTVSLQIPNLLYQANTND
ncbi:MAG TPA: PAS domain-containing sensor histidine kinase [Cytophagaceae bacterium]|jgi:PAS domain S-box-containing protein|nr:PAS domain-containing sensor histidine kinase [Cytophagaceae bacterium]